MAAIQYAGAGLAGLRFEIVECSVHMQFHGLKIETMTIDNLLMK
jgi:hypothetical protein